MKVLLTGGLGVNGSWVVRELLARGDVPITVDAHDDMALVADIAGEFEHHVLDVLDVEGLAELASRLQPERIVHLAAVIAAGETGPYLGYSGNAQGAVAGLEAGRRADVARVGP